MNAWLTRNRLGLLLLPIAILLAIVGSSSRIDNYFWTVGMHQAEHSDSKGVVDFRDTYDDGYLAYPINARISLVSVKKIDSIPSSYDGSPRPVTKPFGSELWRVRLHFEADPSVVMTGCHVAIMDRDGNRFESNSSDYETDGSSPIYQCAPDDTPGPQAHVGSTEKPSLGPGEKPRPRTYETDTYVITTDTAKPKSVRVWFYLPKYAELPID